MSHRPLDLLDISTPAGRAGLSALLADPAQAIVAFDFDGTLAPIVADPEHAAALPGTTEALAQLAAHVGAVAIVTGRPARTAVRLAGLAPAARLGRLVVLGQYGLERWEGESGEFREAEPPPGVEMVRRVLPQILRSVGVPDATIEDKGVAIAVHVRRAAAPADSFERLVRPLQELAELADLAVEPGRLVLELRPRGMDKGRALLDLAAEHDAETLMFTGDDLGDLAAYDAVDRWRANGRPGLLVCSGSDEVAALAARADLVVDGPSGVLVLVERLVRRLGPSPS